MKILYKILAFLNEDFIKLKYKKFIKNLKKYLSKNLPEEIDITPQSIEHFLQNNTETTLFEEAQITIPHISLYHLIERIPVDKKDNTYLKDIKQYLQPDEYMADTIHQHHHDHHHEH